MMECKEILSQLPCGGNKLQRIKNAGLMVGVDLENPIDLSEMQVHSISSQPVFNERDLIMYVERKCDLHCLVVNEHGEEEELEVSFTLKSKRAPKQPTA